MANKPETPQKSSGELSPIVVIGGLLTVKQVAEWYRPILSKDKTAGVPLRKRFLAPPQRGLGNLDEMREEMSELLYKMYSRLGKRKMIIVGHSLGGFMGTVAAMETPEIVAGVFSLGGVHEGYDRETPATLALRHGLGNPSEAKHLWHESDVMLEHKARMATDWPDGVPLHCIATPLDYLIIPPKGFGVTLPNGRPENRLIIPPIPGAATAARVTFRLSEDVGMIKSWYLTEHVNLPHNPQVANYIDYNRREFIIPEIADTTIGNIGNVALAA